MAAMAWWPFAVKNMSLMADLGVVMEAVVAMSSL